MRVRRNREEIQPRPGSRDDAPRQDRQRRRYRQHVVGSARGGGSQRSRRGLSTSRLQGRPRDQCRGVDCLRRAVRLLPGNDPPWQAGRFIQVARPSATTTTIPDTSQFSEVSGNCGSRRQTGHAPITEKVIMRAIQVLVTSMAALTITTAANAQEIDWKKVDTALGKTAAVSGEVHRYGFPRSDLQVTVDGVAIKPALALGGWAAFTPMGGGAMVMGDLVLLETEINPVMAKLIEGGIEITAVHNHLLRANPETFYMHIGGHGDPVKMAEVIRSALALSKTPFAPPAAPAPAPAIDLDIAQLDQIIGAKGQANGGVYQFNVPRRDPITENGITVPTAMGSANAINFQPTGGGKAAITGDFVITGDEVNPMIKALRANGIEVTALHSHMLTEQPRVFFMHFWANDDALKLARGIRAALEKTAIASRQ